jgi:D-alanyl-D-alanine carboxypeptidase (penicillin-binding protein 5/6)
VAGTIADMNAEARRLGAWDTHAETPSGLDGPGQVTSAYDLALIFRAAYAHEGFRRWVATEYHQLTPEMQIQHDNWEYLEQPGSLGGKAGFTDIARHSYVGAFERDGRHLVAAVLGGEIMPLRAWQQTTALLDWGFAQRSGRSVGHLVQPGEAQRLAEPLPGSPSEPSAIGTVTAESSDPPAAALWLATGIGFAAATSVGIMLVTRRRRRPEVPPAEQPPPAN